MVYVYMLYVWWGWLDLNQRPIGYEPTALTTELHPHMLTNPWLTEMSISDLMGNI